MTKTYTFYDDSWWDNPPCDCCEGGLMECYNSSDVMEGLGSAHSLEHCYMQALITETNDTSDYPKYYEMSMEELEKIAEELWISVRIVS